MDERARRLAKLKKDTTGPTRKRVEKTGDFADYSEIKAMSGLVLPEIKKVLLARHHKNAERGRRRSNVVYPSEMARADWCPRATYYRMSGMPEPPGRYSFTLENVFSEGNRIHSKWQDWLSDTGLLWGDWYCGKCDTRISNSVKPPLTPDYINWQPNYPASSHEHEWEYREVTLRSTSLPVSGHADGGLIKHDCLIEIKSVGIGTLKFEATTIFENNTLKIGTKTINDVEGMWKSIHRPLLAHVKQGNIYLWMAKEMGMPFDKIVFLYEFKANQQVREFIVYPSDDILQPMLVNVESIKSALTEGKPPECPHGKGGCSLCRAYEKDV